MRYLADESPSSTAGYLHCIDIVIVGLSLQDLRSIGCSSSPGYQVPLGETTNTNITLVMLSSRSYE